MAVPLLLAAASLFTKPKPQEPSEEPKNIKKEKGDIEDADNKSSKTKQRMGPENV